MPEIEFPNYVAMFAQGAQAGRQMAQQRRRDQALSNYNVDPEGAERDLIAAGDIESANALSQIGQRRQASASRAKASELLAQKDYAGAAAAAAGGGDAQYASVISKLHDDELADKDRKANILGGTLNALLSIPDPGQRKAALQQYRAPLSQQLGVPPEEIDAYDVSDANLRTQLGQTIGFAKSLDLEKERREASKPIAGTPGQVFFDPTTQQPIPGMSVPERPDWRERKRADGSSEWFDIRAAGGASPVGQSAPPQAAGANAPRGLRNNNPLNVRPLSQGQWEGQSGVDGGNYAVFNTPQDGWNAAHRNLATYGSKYGINTVQGVIDRWAPSGDNNNPQSYAATVSKALGVAPNAPINLQDEATRERLLSAMAQVELGRPYAGPGQAPTQPGRPGVVPGDAPQIKDPPAGYRFKPDGTMEAIPGGPGDLKAQAAQAKLDKATEAKETAKAQRAATARTMTQAVDQAIAQIGWGESGIVGQRMSTVPGTKAYDLARNIETIKANLGFDKLAEMRAASPTGGALGAISDRELTFLQSTVASLDIGQSEAQLKANLTKVKASLGRWKDAVDRAEAGESPAGPAQPAAKPATGPAPPVGALKEGAMTTFANGQSWTLANGKPKRLR